MDQINCKMASNQEKAGGYDCHWVESPPDEVICLICLCVAKDPHQHGNGGCGRVFCESCLTEHKKTSNSCPNCCDELATFKDERGARHIKALKVKCSNIENGCQWKGELGSLDAHLQKCKYVLVPCPNECKKEDQIVKVQRKSLQNHLARKCPKRQYHCPHCKETGEYQERTTTHLKTCPKVTQACPNTQCEVRIRRCVLGKHRLECDYEPVPCKYAKVGCKGRPLRKNLLEHEEDHSLHLHVVTEAVLQQQKEVAALKKSQETELAALKKSQETEIAALKKCQETVEVAALKKCQETEIGALKKSVTPFTFRMTNFNQHKVDSYIFYSPPFYTSYAGYKMCVRLDTNGCGNGAGTHVSVFTCLMKGDNDDSLTWPFTGTVTVELLNQLEDKNHYKMSVPLRGDIEVGKRVMDSDRAKTGRGYYKFISHADLVHNPEQNCQYLKDDTLFLKITMKASNNKPWLECTT